jgi:hypothetical protein
MVSTPLVILIYIYLQELLIKSFDIKNGEVY